MKKKAIIITFAAALCALTSCGKDVVSLPDMAASPADNTNAAAMSAAAVTTVNTESTTAAKAAASNNKTAETAISESAAEVTPTAAVTEASQETEALQETAAENNSFKKGVSNGNVYTSEYAGIKITLPEEAHFLDEADLYTHYTMPTRFMSEDEKAFHKTGVLDACVCYDDAIKRVDVWFYDTKLRYPDTPDISAEELLRRYELTFSEDTEVSAIGTPETVDICGKSYVRVNYTIYSQDHISYARRIDDEHIMLIRTSNLSAEEFESFIEAF